MKKIYLFLVFMLVNSAVFGQTAQEKAVQKVMKSYIQYVACHATLGFHKTPRQVLLIPSDIAPRKTYLVPWSGDLHCLGGTGSYKGHIGRVEVLRDGTPIIVESDILQRHSLHDINGEFVTAQMKLTEKGQLKIQAGKSTKAPVHIPDVWLYYVINSTITPDERTFIIVEQLPIDVNK